MGKLRYPFIVFRGSLPEVERLHDSNASPDEKDRARKEVNALIELAKAIADRNTQRSRHKDNHDLRDGIMAGLRRDARGKPVRGEPKRLASIHDVSPRTIQKWIEQLSKPPAKGADAVLADQRTVYYAKMLRHQNSLAGSQRKKRIR